MSDWFAIKYRDPPYDYTLLNPLKERLKNSSLPGFTDKQIICIIRGIGENHRHCSMQDRIRKELEKIFYNHGTTIPDYNNGDTIYD